MEKGTEKDNKNTVMVMRMNDNKYVDSEEEHDDIKKHNQPSSCGIMSIKDSPNALLSSWETSWAQKRCAYPQPFTLSLTVDGRHHAQVEIYAPLQ